MENLLDARGGETAERLLHSFVSCLKTLFEEENHVEARQR